MTVGPRQRATVALAACAILAGCASTPEPTAQGPTDPAVVASSPASDPTFAVNAPGAVGIAVIAGVAVLALLVAQDGALSFD